MIKKKKKSVFKITTKIKGRITKFQSHELISATNQYQIIDKIHTTYS